MLLRLALPLLLWAAFIAAIYLTDRFAGRRAGRPPDEAEHAVEPPETEPPQEHLLAA